MSDRVGVVHMTGVLFVAVLYASLVTLTLYAWDNR